MSFRKWLAWVLWCSLWMTIGQVACRRAPSSSPDASSVSASATASVAASAVQDTARHNALMFHNTTDKPTTVYIAFGADSVIVASSWATFCSTAAPLNCSFSLPGKTMREAALDGKYLNATIAFGAPVGCGSTKAELNINNPAWYDVVDVSLVDGFSNLIEIDLSGERIGPPHGAGNNEKVLGVYPLGCDLCTATSNNAPCGMKPPGVGCKAGSQYAPAVPCQFQGPTRGGSAGPVTVVLVAGVPA